MRSTVLLVTCLSLACATSAARGPGSLYAMPTEPADAIAPEDADPSHPGEVAESALHLLDPGQAGGPDYQGAARTCLIAAEGTRPGVEDALALACLRLAARSALRSGDRELYLHVIETWEQRAPKSQRSVGELAVHRSVRDRLQGRRPRYERRLPGTVSSLIPPAEGGS